MKMMWVQMKNLKGEWVDLGYADFETYGLLKLKHRHAVRGFRRSV